MSDRAALLAAICAHPAEDTPRLVYADWLDENADAFPAPAAARAHAQFVRTDVLMAQRDEYDPERLRWELIDKPREETRAWVGSVLPPLPNGVAFERTPLFRRGLPWAVRLATPRPAAPDPPAGAFPLERAVYHECVFAPEFLAAAPWRGRLRELEFAAGGTTLAAHRLLATDGLDRLERLSLLNYAIGAQSLTALVESPLFGRLSALAVTDSPVGAALAAALARAGACPLRELHLVGCRLTPAALGAVVGVLASGRLEALSAGGDRIGAPEKFRVFARAALPPLRSLDMSDDAPKEGGLEAFLASPVVGRLQRLRLAGCNLNGARVRLLAGGAFANLRALDLARNPVGNEGVAALARSPHLAGLRVLNLGYAQVGDAGILALLDSPLADGLVLLDLTAAPASEEAKELLVGRMGDRVRV